MSTPRQPSAPAASHSPHPGASIPWRRAGWWGNEWLILGGVVIAVLAIDWRATAAVAPGPHVKTLADLWVAKGEPLFLAHVTLEGEERIVWLGHRPAGVSMGGFASGPPVYVFDKQERLIGWQWDTGDGGPLEHWADAAKAQRRQAQAGG